VAPKEALAQAQKLYDSLEYDKVAPLAALALTSPDLTLDEKLTAYQLQGSALAIIGDSVAAERPFVLILSVRPDFMLPDDTPPKIKAVFAKVKGEFDQVRRDNEARSRKELAATIELQGTPPATAVGGRPLRFELGVADPRGVVKTVRVQYRKKGETEYLALPLMRGPTGQWQGAVPGEWTASDAGFAMDCVVIVADATGPLKSVGEPTPLTIDVSPGQVDRTARPVPLWVFGTAAGVTGAALVASAGLAGATLYVNDDYHSKLQNSTADDPVEGSDIVQQEDLGNSLNVAQVAAWGAFGVTALVTGVLALFTNWSGEEALEEEVPNSAPTAPATAAR
jgi:hypothetical protein